MEQTGKERRNAHVEARGHITWRFDHVSIEMDRTKLTLTPKLRCFPAHSRQMSVPWLTLAQPVSME